MAMKGRYDVGPSWFPFWSGLLATMKLCASGLSGRTRPDERNALEPCLEPGMRSGWPRSTNCDGISYFAGEVLANSREAVESGRKAVVTNIDWD